MEMGAEQRNRYLATYHATALTELMPGQRIQAAGRSETLAPIYQATRRHITGDLILSIYLRENIERQICSCWNFYILLYRLLKPFAYFYFITYLLTELSPSWEAANCAATQELPSDK
jgi:hypothetical protein